MKCNHIIHIDQLEIAYSATDEVKAFFATIEEGRSCRIKDVLLVRKKPYKYYFEFCVYLIGHTCDGGRDEKLIGALWFQCPNRFRQDVYLRFDNEALYDSELLSSRFHIESVLKLQFKYVSKIDIAMDFNFNIQRYLMKAYKDMDYELIVNSTLANDAKVSNVGGYASNNPRLCPFKKHELIISNKGKNLTMKCYDKAKEISENSRRKEYINKSNGFSGHTTYRVEVSCKNHKMLYKSLSSLEYSDYDLYTQLEKKELLYNIFNHVMHRLIRLRKKGGRKSIGLLDLALMKMEDN